MKRFVLALLLAGCMSDPLKSGSPTFVQPEPPIQDGPVATLKLSSTLGLRLDRYTVERLPHSTPTSHWFPKVVELPPGAGATTFQVEVGKAEADMINCRVTLYGSTYEGLAVEIPTNVPIRGGTPSEH